jgi:AAA family ATP:ADP antiporter
MLLVASAILVVTLVLTNVIDSRERARAARTKTADTSVDEPIGRSGAFRLVMQNRYLLLIAFLMLFTNWVNTTGEYILGRVVTKTAADAIAAGTAGDLSEGQFIGKFYSNFFLGVNVFGVIMQVLLVSRILKYLGTRVALLFLPIIALGGYVLLAVYPVLGVVRWAKTLENGTDYSLNNTVRNVLFLPTTREQKYKAKQAIDTLFVRLGDLLSAGLVLVGTSVFVLRTEDFAIVNVVLATIWIAIAVAIGREHAKLMHGNADKS